MDCAAELVMSMTPTDTLPRCACCARSRRAAEHHRILKCLVCSTPGVRVARRNDVNQKVASYSTCTPGHPAKQIIVHLVDSEASSSARNELIGSNVPLQRLLKTFLRCNFWFEGHLCNSRLKNHPPPVSRQPACMSATCSGGSCPLAPAPRFAALEAFVQRSSQIQSSSYEGSELELTGLK